VTALLTLAAMLVPAPVPDLDAAAAAAASTRQPIICGTACKQRTVAPYRAKLTRMAWCESRGRWGIATGNGYYGGLQFDLPTWRSVGGQGLPHLNPRLEQMYRAVRLIRRRGYAPWPRCGRM
jgi:hypothetical protein